MKYFYSGWHLFYLWFLSIIFYSSDEKKYEHLYYVYKSKSKVLLSRENFSTGPNADSWMNSNRNKISILWWFHYYCSAFCFNGLVKINHRKVPMSLPSNIFCFWFSSWSLKCKCFGNANLGFRLYLGQCINSSTGMY